MNLINDLDGELAYAVLIEKRHSGKLNSDEIIPLIERLNDALRKISSKENPPAKVLPTSKSAGKFSH